MDFADPACDRRIHIRLHFHRFQRQKLGIARHGLVQLDRDRCNEAGRWRRHLSGIGRIRLGMRSRDNTQGTIADVDLARLSVQFKE